MTVPTEVARVQGPTGGFPTYHGPNRLQDSQGKILHDRTNYRGFDS